MANFEERITRDTAPTIRLEHQLRYRSVRPIVMGSDVWCDLGCGNGIAASAAVDGQFAGKVVLVDVAEEAVHEAAGHVPAADIQTLRADLSVEDELSLVHRALLHAPPETGCITCFELVEHLTSFSSLVELLVEASASGYTVVLSVPNDAFVSLENPFHNTTWGEATFEELRRLVPEEHVAAVQLELRGSAIARPTDELATERELSLTVPRRLVASHFLLAFGPRAHLLETPAHIEATDRDATRLWERQRDSDLAYFRARLKELESEIVAPQAE